jgi:hypothetical protein
MINQDDYDRIRFWVRNGHALHPDDARELLVAFDEIYQAADRQLESPHNVALSELMYDDQGMQRLRVGGDDASQG